MYFANDGSDLTKVVNAISNNVKEELETQNIIKVQYTTNDPFNDSFINKKTDILSKIKTTLGTLVPRVSIATTELTNLKDYYYMNRWGTFADFYDKIDYNPLTIENMQDHLGSITNFNNAWKTPVDNRLNDFKTVLDKWIVDEKVTISQPDNVFVIGNYETTNWSIDGLELKTITIPYYVSSNKTRVIDTQDSLDIVNKLFVDDNPLFNYPNNISNDNNKPYNYFNFNILPTDFDNFINKDVSLQEIYEYITNKTTTFLTKQGVSGNITWVNSNFSNLLTQKINDISHIKISNNQIWVTNWAYVWRLNINGNTFAFSFGNNGSLFSITSSADAIWPS
ncbi:hypothetical protein [Spiroplasma endosymbiont of Nebria brevicollis]|uniref:hypothetical protein n=1 Tax=Spiroplasma endosymbiont of Nebria brevicollis TaxID=3066284 RepID=UPI00313A797F